MMSRSGMTSRSPTRCSRIRSGPGRGVYKRDFCRCLLQAIRISLIPTAFSPHLVNVLIHPSCYEFSMRTKSCLKESSFTPSPEPAERGDVSPIYTERRKSVTFSMKGEEDIQEEVFYADEWDRSPIEATPKLTYRDVLELMELRLSIPRIRFPGRQRRGSLDSLTRSPSQ